MTRQTSLDGGLRTLFRENVPKPIHWQTIETWAVSPGVPDANYCAEGQEGWVEFKLTAGWKPRVAPEQVAWALQRVRHGGRVWFAVRRQCPAGPRREAADDLWLVRGAAARELCSGGLSGLPSSAVAGAWGGGPARWPWRTVRALLLG